MSDEKKGNRMQDGFSRRSVLGMGSAALAAATLAGFTAHAQTREGTRQAEGDHSSSNPGQENRALLAENPTQIHLRRRITGMSVPFGTPSI